MMKRLAVGLIGLLAGAELRLADLRLRHRADPVDPGAARAWRCCWRLWAPRSWPARWIPFLAGSGRGAAAAVVALLFATTLTVN